jgi:hypothetical protein
MGFVGFLLAWRLHGLRILHQGRGALLTAIFWRYAPTLVQSERPVNCLLGCGHRVKI